MSSVSRAAVSPIAFGDTPLLRVSDAAGETLPQRPPSPADGGAWPDLAVDYQDVYALSQRGLAMLAALHRQVEARGGRLTLLNVRLPAYVVLAVTGLADVLDVR